VSQPESKQLIFTALETVGLVPEEVIDKYPHQLSGGQRQRIMLARAFVLKPKIIFLDEPVSMVDSSLRAVILRDISRLKKEYGMSFIYITHDLSTAYNISDNIIILYRGKVVECGDVDKVFDNPVHPYLQSLISSVPSPDPNKRWKEKIDFKIQEITYTTDIHGCKYYDRCHKKNEKCLNVTPKLHTIEEDHQVACHLT